MNRHVIVLSGISLIAVSVFLPRPVGAGALCQLAGVKPDDDVITIESLLDEMIDRGIARHGYRVMRAGEQDPIGVVTSGSQSPTLGRAIAMAYVPPKDAAAGTMLEVIVRGTAVPAEVVTLPFYRRPGR